MMLMRYFRKNGYTIILAGRKDDTHRQGVAFVLLSQYAEGLVSYEAVSPRTVSVWVKTRTGVRNTIHIYAPYSSYTDEHNQDFLDLLQLDISAVQKGE